jgi:hypothetical protein
MDGKDMLLKNVRSRIVAPLLVLMLAPAVAGAQTRADCIKRQLHRLLWDDKAVPAAELTPVTDPTIRQTLFVQTPVEASFAAYGVVPEDNCVFKAVFGRTPTARDTTAVEKARTSLKALAPEFTANRMTAEGFREFVRDADEQFLIIIGHNDAGKFRFADGEAMPLADMAGLCVDRGKRCIFLSCEAMKALPESAVGAAKPLTYEKAFFVATRLKRFGEQRRDKQSVSLDDIVKEMQSAQLKFQTLNFLSTGAKLAATGIAIMAIYQATEDSNEPHKPR